MSGLCCQRGILYSSPAITDFRDCFQKKRIEGVPFIFSNGPYTQERKLVESILVTRVCKPLSVLSFVVIDCRLCDAFFIFLKGRRFFLIQFCLGGKCGSYIANFGLCLALRGLQTRLPDGQVCIYRCKCYLEISVLYLVNKYLLFGVKSIFIDFSISIISFSFVKLFFSNVFSKTFCKLPSPR
jgi:hypothetical protein